MSETHPGDDLIALALDDLHPRERTAAVEHLLACPKCREEYDAVAATVENTLVAAPAVGPPPGFEKRVLAALGVGASTVPSEPVLQPVQQPVQPPAVQRPRASAGKHLGTRSRRSLGPVHGQWLAVAASAVLGLALGAGVTHALQDDSAPNPPSASNRPAKPPGSQLSMKDGTVVGAVTTSSVGAKQVYVVTVSSGPVGMRYKCQLRLQDGRIVPAGRVLLNSQSAVWVLPAQPKAVKLELIARDGKGPLWSTARL
jgi:anti-sigma factor RsiW